MTTESTLSETTKEQVQEMQESAAEHNKRSKLVYIAGSIGAVCVVAGIVAGLWFLNSGSSAAAE
jgi:hypothetical protein